MVGAIIAALLAAQPGALIVVTATTNAAVAQFTETLLSLRDFPQLSVIRFVSDAAISENRSPTSVDLNTVLMDMER